MFILTRAPIAFELKCQDKVNTRLCIVLINIKCFHWLLLGFMNMKRTNQFPKTCTQNLRKLEYGTMTKNISTFLYLQK